ATDTPAPTETPLPTVELTPTITVPALAAPRPPAPLSLRSPFVAQSQGAQPQLRLVVVNVASPAQLNKLTRMNLDIAAIREGPEVSGPRGLSMPSYRAEIVVS